MAAISFYIVLVRLLWFPQWSAWCPVAMKNLKSSIFCHVFWQYTAVAAVRLFIKYQIPSDDLLHPGESATAEKRLELVKGQVQAGFLWLAGGMVLLGGGFVHENGGMQPFFWGQVSQIPTGCQIWCQKWWFSIWGPNRWGNQRPGHWMPLDSADFLWQAMLSMIEVELLD